MLDLYFRVCNYLTVATTPHLRKEKMLVTDMIAVSLGLIAALILALSVTRANTRLERENRYLRARISDMRKQMNNMVERPF